MKSDDERDPLLGHAVRKLDDIRPGGSTCLDAETVAAWSEDALPRTEVAALEAHAAGCARCRALLAVFTRTEPAALGAVVPWWKAPVLRWAPPVAAMAAAAVIWVAVDRRSMPDPADVPAANTSEPHVRAERRPDSAAPAEPPAERPEQAAPRQRAERTQPARDQAGAPLKPATPSPAPAAAASPPATRTARNEAEAARGLALDSLGFQAAPPVVAASPDGSVQWRAQAGRLDRSTDKGASWETQPLSPGFVPTTGQCVTAEVCWLAGRDGVVLRTTDGRVWAETARPAPVDIMSIRPADALNAAVTTADGRIFVTSDGGRTWTLQEIPAAPF